MAISSFRRTFLLAVVGLGWLLAACGGATQAPTSGPAAQAASAVPAATPAPSPAPAAEASPANSAPAAQSGLPRWILAGSVPDVIEGMSTLFAIDADTGASWPVCPLTGEFSVSPDGRWVVCPYWYGDPKLKLFELATLASIAPNDDVAAAPQIPGLGVTVPDDFSMTDMDWSADSRQLAISTFEGLYAINLAAGGKLRQLLACDTDFKCSGVAWSPDGQLLAYGRDNGLFVLDQAGTERKLTSHGIFPRDPSLYKQDDIFQVEDLRWSDDGQRISYATRAGVFEVAAFSDDTDQAPLTSAPYQTPVTGAPVTSADGRCVLEVRQTNAAGLVNDPPQEPSDIIQAGYGLFVSLAANPANAVQVAERLFPYHNDAVWVAGEPAQPLLKETTPPMRGCAVLEAQATLQQRGYDVGAIDGIYGVQTAEAVRSFQRDNGLDTDGVVGPATWAILR
jgi:hypothetical protein